MITELETSKEIENIRKEIARVNNCLPSEVHVFVSKNGSFYDWVLKPALITSNSAMQQACKDYLEKFMEFYQKTRYEDLERIKKAYPATISSRSDLELMTQFNQQQNSGRKEKNEHA